MEHETNDVSGGAIAALYSALAKAQGEFLPLMKNREVEIAMSKGGRFKFRYADMEACIAVTRPALSANGLAVFQRVMSDQLITTLAHKDGGTIESASDLPKSHGDIKQYGAAITYLRRYSYTALLCISADDDLDEHEPGIQGAPASAAVDISPALNAIKGARTLGELNAAGKSANAAYPGRRASFVTAYNERKAELLQEEARAAAEAALTETAEPTMPDAEKQAAADLGWSDGDDIPGI